MGLEKIVDFILHVDKYISILIENFGAWTYLFLFLIILCETGLVITPFLPGDSLLFVVGAFAAQGSFNIIWMYFILIFAAILGDSLNYWIGHYFGENVFANWKFFKKKHLEKAKKFYEKHGGKTIIYARFIPIIRTFAPFVAGVGKMRYSRFLSFNIIGGIAWVTLFLFAGYFFGSIPIIEKNLTTVIFLIIGLSILPPIYEYINEKRK